MVAAGQVQGSFSWLKKKRQNRHKLLLYSEGWNLAIAFTGCTYKPWCLQFWSVSIHFRTCTLQCMEPFPVHETRRHNIWEAYSAGSSTRYGEGRKHWKIKFQITVPVPFSKVCQTARAVVTQNHALCRPKMHKNCTVMDNGPATVCMLLTLKSFFYPVIIGGCVGNRVLLHFLHCFFYPVIIGGCVGNWVLLHFLHCFFYPVIIGGCVGNRVLLHFLHCFFYPVIIGGCVGNRVLLHFLHCFFYPVIIGVCVGNRVLLHFLHCFFYPVIIGGCVGNRVLLHFLHCFFYPVIIGGCVGNRVLLHFLHCFFYPVIIGGCVGNRALLHFLHCP